jgi:hypothetical protein
MRLICALSIVFVLGTTSRSWAGDDYVYVPPLAYSPKIVPQCGKFAVPSVGTVCGYLNVEDWKAVLAADAELVEARERLKKDADLEVALNLQVTALQEQVDLLTSAKKAVVERNAKLEKDYIDLDEKYQNERVKPRWGTPLAWGTAAAAVAVLAGVLLYGALN